MPMTDKTEMVEKPVSSLKLYAQKSLSNDFDIILLEIYVEYGCGQYKIFNKDRKFGVTFSKSVTSHHRYTECAHSMKHRYFIFSRRNKSYQNDR